MLSKIKKILRFLDTHLLTILTGILIVIIPLYPKLPLADLIEGYIVRLRLEDIAIFLALVIWGIQILRKKIIFPKTKIAKLILIYLAFATLSAIAAVLVTKTVPLERAHLQKLALHLFRRFEYFSLFFIAYSGVKTKRDLKVFIYTILFTFIAAVGYGFGQKYLYWPAFSTMNREFSKGVRLYLSPTSRVMSTFGGHYDYAAYLMMLLSALVSVVWLVKSKVWFILFSLLFLGAYWSLILTASRTSFAGYLVGITAIFYCFAKIKGFKWSVRRWLVTMTVSFSIMIFFGDLSERFYQLVQSPAAIQKFVPWMETGKIEEKIYEVKDFFYALEAWKNNLANPPLPPPPENSISMDELSRVAVSSDIPPSATKPLPPDVTKEEEEIRERVASESAGANQTPEVGGYSENALKYGLSLAIRLDALWPRAIEGFMRNPLLGSGFSTLTKSTTEEFTSAESTDNDYLRMLGETGLLGTLSFLAILFVLMRISYQGFKRTTSIFKQVLYLGSIGAIAGLLVNATYIDVFESSKIAYTLWIIAALVVRSLELDHKDEKQT
ncbi:MAG: O-antigen polymerase [Microgenomates group bacterium GW2011_GWF2_47_9]|nr:MAG: O-antigen polymerase [Microgenomates group bacterium GW2011_GWF2_47_9]